MTFGKGEMVWSAINMESDFTMQNLLIVKRKEAAATCATVTVSQGRLFQNLEK